ncbi:Gfo/Idh/MocA family oxidoreductase [Paenalkalicoccus suaedae]|uniref:Gfo/Idh/MocA family oxidoreductase n=1 Tax=Paenalkalicoccus suaedae TaxID=2592382 RepID=A0A859FB49_9BACI|nr:Gfo/Idh/MocA family oxidoreductase [Paenalkalicoccus suaedae]QKS70028.1 Gfo/Idh/MocA family oxidoreductase [Paenalkalicoccus suaedae]
MNIGTIGTGFIVDRFIEASHNVPHMNVTASFSRQEETAKSFTHKHNIASYYTDIEALLGDTSIDAIYVASPNSLHYTYTVQALEHGKHVFCEKPFTSNSREAQHVIELAKERNLFLFEAITTIHLPNYALIREHIASLGPIRLVQANYSQYSSRYDKFLAGETPNVFSPHYSGGALQDINVYNLHFVIGLFGKPESVTYAANVQRDIDTSGIALLTYDGYVASCAGAKDTASDGFVYMQGEKGFIHVVQGANGCREVVIKVGNSESRLNAQTEDNVLYYEIAAWQKLMANNDFDACYKLLDHSLHVMQTLEKARASAGVRFEGDN